MPLAFVRVQTPVELNARQGKIPVSVTVPACEGNTEHAERFIVLIGDFPGLGRTSAIEALILSV